MASPAPRIALRDVTLRDGLQDEAPVPTEAKVALFEALVAAGIKDLEVTSFVRPDRVPAMADAADMAAATSALAQVEGVERWGLVLNLRGAERAVAAGIDRLQYVLSVSETHNQHNAGGPVERSLGQLAELAAFAGEAGARVEVTLSTAFGCPYEGAVDPSAVLGVAERVLGLGVAAISLADTIGTGIPPEVSLLVRDAVSCAGEVPVGVHLHDTRGLAMANALAALDAGAARLDASVGGLGGCPFAPGASGNLALEDLVHALEAMGWSTGIDLGRLLDAARLACEVVGRPVGSHVGVAGPRFVGVSM